MHFTHSIAASTVLASLLGASCSAGDGSGNSEMNARDSTATQDSGSSSNTPEVSFDGEQNTPTQEEPALPPTTDVEDPPLTVCQSANECCEKFDGCQNASEYICTRDGYCGLIKEAKDGSSNCSEQSDCQADTSCCIGEQCLGNDSDAGVCIPANVPTGAACNASAPLGVFSPNVQCEWQGPESHEAYPNSNNVSATPLVADLPIASGEVNQANPDGTSAELVIITWEHGSGPGQSDGSNNAKGVIRILDGQNCQLLHSIVDTNNWPRANSTPALADLDGDGSIEIVARRNAGGIVAYTYDPNLDNEYGEKGAYKVMFSHNGGGGKTGTPGQSWDGPAIHDLDDDGRPEILVQNTVFAISASFDSVNVAQSGSLSYPWNGMGAVAGDFDSDGKVELASLRYNSERALYEWNSGWEHEKTLANQVSGQFAFADFGTAGATHNDFNPRVLDGVPEIVGTDDSSGIVVVHTLEGHLVMSATTGDRGGPPNIGDFDGDGFPEIGVAGRSAFRVFDFDCAAGCEGNPAYVRWSKSAQDVSSAQTGATIFDFDSDGSAEVVYADECFLRVYDGKTGNVLYSAPRTSETWFESPLVSDIDQDQNTEIVINSSIKLNADAKCAAAVDSIHPGIPCDSDTECPETSTCGNGLCRCSTDAQCRGQAPIAEAGLSCAASANGTGNVCRSTHPGSDNADYRGIRVLRDSLDRWASSRSIWNQHAYSITNVNDDGSIPRTSEWQANWKKDGLNNYRQNVQGVAGFTDLPDITGRFAGQDTCVTGSSSSQVYLQATVCNRGKRAVGSELPATFYLGEQGGEVLCTSFTDGPVPTGGCKLVYCAIGSDIAGEKVTLVVNDDGDGGQSTIECNPDNNNDSTLVESCVIPVPR